MDSDVNRLSTGDFIGRKQKTPSLKQKVLRGSAWTFAAYGATQFLRLGSNLVLTRLLFPEAFGVMVLVNAALQGLQMCSDLGLSPSIIQNPRGEEPGFLRTAWTLQIVRGMALWIATALLAWPLARFYDQPSLLVFLPAAGSTAFISSFATTNLYLANRRLQLGKLSSLEFFSQVVGVCVMITWAWRWPSVWALVGGAIVATITKSALSHVVMPDPPMRFEFHRDIAKELFTFGKWVFVATVLGFLVHRVDRLLLGKFMSMGELGVYSIAFMLSTVMLQLTQALSGRVLMPLYADINRSNPARLRSHTYRIRKALLAVTLPPMWFLIILGSEVIAFLYDDRYAEAGWMLQLLAVGALLNVITAPIDSVLLASGDSRRHLLNVMARAGVLLSAMAVSCYAIGRTGIIIGLVATPLLHYPFQIMLVRRYNVWLPKLDVTAMVVSGFFLALGFWLKKTIMP